MADEQAARDAQQQVSIPLTPAVHEEITALAEFWRTRALLRAVEVDGLKVELAKSREELQKAGEALEALTSPAGGAN